MEQVSQKTYRRIKDEDLENDNNEGQESYGDHRDNHPNIIQEHLHRTYNQRRVMETIETTTPTSSRNICIEHIIRGELWRP
jgi:hypothetical protein